MSSSLQCMETKFLYTFMCTKSTLTLWRMYHYSYLQIQLMIHIIMETEALSGIMQVSSSNNIQKQSKPQRIVGKR